MLRVNWYRLIKILHYLSEWSMLQRIVTKLTPLYGIEVTTEMDELQGSLGISCKFCIKLKNNGRFSCIRLQYRWWNIDANSFKFNIMWWIFYLILYPVKESDGIFLFDFFFLFEDRKSDEFLFYFFFCLRKSDGFYFIFISCLWKGDGLLLFFFCLRKSDGLISYIFFLFMEKWWFLLI